MTHGDELEAVRKRLDVIINILMEPANGEARTVASRILQLLDYGLRQSEVAEIVGKETKYVGAVVSNSRRGKKANGAAKEATDG